MRLCSIRRKAALSQGMRRIEGRTAVITGAASGIGRATAIALQRAGADLALVDINEVELSHTRQLLSNKTRVTNHVADVSELTRMSALVDEVLEAHGRVEILVNNAGVGVAGTFLEQSLEDMQWLMGINFWGVVYGCKLFLPHLLLADEAHIVNVSSVFGVVGMPLSSSYCASKFAVRGLSEAMRAELADGPVGVTSVHPGGINTNIARDSRYFHERADARDRAVTLFKGFLPPERVASAIVSAIRKNSQRVLVAKEAHVLDVAARLSPSLLGTAVAKAWRRFF